MDELELDPSVQLFGSETERDRSLHCLGERRLRAGKISAVQPGDPEADQSGRELRVPGGEERASPLEQRDGRRSVGAAERFLCGDVQEVAGALP